MSHSKSLKIAKNFSSFVMVAALAIVAATAMGVLGYNLASAYLPEAFTLMPPGFRDGEAPTHGGITTVFAGLGFFTVIGFFGFADNKEDTPPTFKDHLVGMFIGLGIVLVVAAFSIGFVWGIFALISLCGAFFNYALQPLGSLLISVLPAIPLAGSAESNPITLHHMLWLWAGLMLISPIVALFLPGEGNNFLARYGRGVLALWVACITFMALYCILLMGIGALFAALSSLWFSIAVVVLFIISLAPASYVWGYCAIARPKPAEQ